MIKYRKFTLALVGMIITLVMYCLSPKDISCLTAGGGTLVAVLAFFNAANSKEHAVKNGNGG